jgi:hypothetical protein
MNVLRTKVEVIIMQQLIAWYSWGELVRFTFPRLRFHRGLILFCRVHPHQGCEGPSGRICLRGGRCLLILIESLLSWRLRSVLKPLGRVDLSQLQIGFTRSLENGLGSGLGQLALLVLHQL